MQKHFPVNFHLIHEHELPKNSFMVDEAEYDVPCIFQIWIKKDTERDVEEKVLPNKYKFVKKKEKHDISFRRVGGQAGFIDKDTIDKSEQSHYFIKFDTELTDDLFEILQNIEYKCRNNTCGPRSISKQELIKEWNNYLDKDDIR